MYQALYRKYRPKKFDDVVGQDVVIKTLKNAIEKDKISHAYLFAGPRGCGKTTIAKIFARLVNCKNPENGNVCGKCVCCTQTDDQNMDIIEMDAASNNGVDEIREINNKVKLAPTLGKYKIYIIDEVHMLTIGAFNALLKTLEEPPAHIIFLLATTDPHKVPITILSRCQRFDLKKISNDNIERRLKYICDNENIKIEDAALKEISRLGDGCLRDSIGILDQVIAYADDKIKVSDIYEVNGTISQNDVCDILISIQENDLKSTIEKINLFSNNGKSMIKITEEIILFIRNCLLSKSTDLYNDEIYNKVCSLTSTTILLKYIDILNQSLLEMKKFSNTKMILELALIKMLSKNEISSTKEEEKKTIDSLKYDENNKTSDLKKHNEKIKILDSTQSEEKEIELSKINSNNKIVEPKKTMYDKLDNSQNQVSQQETISKKIEEFIDIRVNNTLCSFNKKQTLDIRNKINALNDYVMDEKYGSYVTMLLDGELKAVGKENIIFTYSTINLSNLFNENINKLENTLSELLGLEYKLIAVDSDYWNELKQQFNNKTKKFVHKEEIITMEEILKSLNTDKDTMKSLFGDIVEYN